VPKDLCPLFANPAIIYRSLVPSLLLNFNFSPFLMVSAVILQQPINVTCVNSTYLLSVKIPCPAAYLKKAVFKMKLPLYLKNNLQVMST
jgi:hypothetical protein